MTMNPNELTETRAKPMTYHDTICDIARNTNPGDDDENTRIIELSTQFKTPAHMVWMDVVIKRRELEQNPNAFWRLQ